MVFPLLLVVIYFAGCGYTGDSTQIITKEDHVHLTWSPGEPTLFTGNAFAGRYQVFYKERDESSWNFLGEVPASENPEFIVEHAAVGDGEFDFAVRAVNVSRKVSSLHASSDTTARPIGGWHLIWISGE